MESDVREIVSVGVSQQHPAVLKSTKIKSFYSEGVGRLLWRLKNRSGFLPTGSAPALGYGRRERSLVW